MLMYACTCFVCDAGMLYVGARAAVTPDWLSGVPLSLPVMMGILSAFIVIVCVALIYFAWKHMKDTRDIARTVKHIQSRPNIIKLQRAARGWKKGSVRCTFPCIHHAHRMAILYAHAMPMLACALC